MTKPKKGTGQMYRVVRDGWVYPADAEMHQRLTHHADIDWNERGMVDGPAEGAIIYASDLPEHAISSGLKNDILEKYDPAKDEPEPDAPPAEDAGTEPVEEGG